MSSILRQANNRFRRDDRAMDEDEELWFNDDDCEEEPGESVSSGSGEPDKDMAAVRVSAILKAKVETKVLSFASSASECF